MSATIPEPASRLQHRGGDTSLARSHAVSPTVLACCCSLHQPRMWERWLYPAGRCHPARPRQLARSSPADDNAQLPALLQSSRAVNFAMCTISRRYRCKYECVAWFQCTSNVSTSLPQQIVKLEALGQCISAKAHLISIAMRIRIRDSDRHQNLIVCLLIHCQPSLKISCKSVRKFLRKVA